MRWSEMLPFCGMKLEIMNISVIGFRCAEFLVCAEGRISNLCGEKLLSTMTFSLSPSLFHLGFAFIPTYQLLTRTAISSSKTLANGRRHPSKKPDKNTTRRGRKTEHSSAALDSVLNGLTKYTEHQVSSSSSEHRNTRRFSHRFTVLTFNDVYELSPSHDGTGGLANICSLIHQQINQLSEENTPHICTLNGDFLSASLLAPKFLGMQMIDVLNTIPLTHASIGNHEFDFKNQAEPSDVILHNCIKASNFSWLNSNVFAHGSLFPSTIPKEVITLTNEHGEQVRIGLFALCTRATRILSFPPDYVEFEHPVQSARRMVRLLREHDKCDILIALTHLSMQQDVEVATSVPGIDLIIGGHDHQPITQQHGSTTIIKCGQNAKFLGRIDLHIEKQTIDLQDGTSVDTVNCMPEWKFMGNFGYPPHKDTLRVVQEYAEHLPSDWEEFLGICGKPLDSTTSLCRSTETTMCSLLTDALLEHYKCDAVIVNAGIIRGDRVYSVGHRLKKGDLYVEFPFQDHAKIGMLTGANLIGAIEDGLKNIGLGGFPHLSRGLCVTFDPDGEIGSRIVEITLNGEEIDREKEYSVVSTDWLFLHGGDGYKHLQKGRMIPHEQDALSLRQHAMDYVKEKQVVKIELEGRMKKL